MPPKSKPQPPDEKPYTAHLVRRDRRGGIEHVIATVPAELLDLCEVKKVHDAEGIGFVANRVRGWFERLAFGTESA